MRVAVIPGSFDPITNGHMDIILRAKELFDRVVVLVAANAEKNPSFTPEERVLLIEKCIAGYDNVMVDCFDGLLVDYVKQVKACAIVKGLRAMSDFEYEFQMALYNKKLYPEAETLFMTTSTENLYLSSSGVKSIARYGRDVSEFVPTVIADQVLERISRVKGVK